MKQLLLSAFLLASAVCRAQLFEGTLTYVQGFTVSGKLAEMGVTKEELVKRMSGDGNWADTSITIYKSGRYNSRLLTPSPRQLIYQPESNKLFSFQSGGSSNLCVVIDAGLDSEQLMLKKAPTIALVDTAVTINGAACKVVRVKWQLGHYDYYYDPSKLKVDANLFSGHIYDGFAAYLSIAKALPVRIVKATPMMTFTMNLVSVKEHPVDSSVFTVPELVDDPELKAMGLGNQKIMRIKDNN